MSGEFLGTYTVSVYKDKYIVIPAAFKKEFSPAIQNEVVVTFGPTYNISIYPKDNWDLLHDNIHSEKQKKLKDFLIQNGCKCQFEKNGRLKLDDNYRKFAGIDTHVVIKGEGSYISVWNPDRYQAYHDKIMEEYKDAFTAMDYRL